VSDVVLTLENLSKAYRIGLKEEIHHTLTAAALSWVKAPARNLKRLHRLNTFARISNGGTTEPADVIWALRDVNFEIRRGEVVGVIGRNGAGKSTLLKILSRIVRPTRGRAVIHGRVSSLLEVGTGFHGELTGRENVYLNGTILGMRKREIDQKFDEIVDFSGVEKFIDTPVKRYSSGMTVRLAFAVAAHLDPEILIVDEVLAVGDAAFQEKCVRKIESVANNSRTVLFVSHNMQMVETLCSRGLLLREGCLVADGSAEDTLRTYHSDLHTTRFTSGTAVGESYYRRGSGAVRFSDIRLADECGREQPRFKFSQPFRFTLEFKVIEDVTELHLAVYVRAGSSKGFLASSEHCIANRPLKAGTTGHAIVEFPQPAFCPGTYPLYFWMGDRHRRPFDVVDNLTGPLVIVPNGTTTPSALVAVPSHVVSTLQPGV